jgi:hypothetical protein
MSNSATRVDVHAAELALVSGDLGKLTPDQRVGYYQSVCQSLGLNPLTQPFSYITLNGKLTLYARKDATDQLRKVNGVSIGEPNIRFEDDWIIVTVSARTTEGRTDSDIGVVSRKDMRGDFGNALMKAVTKAKRRVTLSLCGLGMLDETEVETIPDARPEAEPPKQLAPAADPDRRPDDARELLAAVRDAGSMDALHKAWTAAYHRKGEFGYSAWGVVERAKDDRKAALSADPAPAAEPAPPADPPGEDRDGLLYELYSACEVIKTPAHQMLARHRKQVGAFPENKPLPKVEELDLPALKHLLALVQQQADAAVESQEREAAK